MKTQYQECSCNNEEGFDHYKHAWREDHEQGKHVMAMWWCASCMKDKPNNDQENRLFNWIVDEQFKSLMNSK